MYSCRVCEELKEDSEFYKSNKRLCKICANNKTYSYAKLSRTIPEHAYRWIYTDAKASDRKSKLYFNLSKEWIKTILISGCSYCGNKDMRMTLDRIDNTKGHTQDNVVPACERCNYLRRDMPYQAWLHIVPSIKEAYSKGLFGNWIGSTHR